MSLIGAFSALGLACLAIGLTAVGVAHAAGRTLTVNTTVDGLQGSGSSCSAPTAGGGCTLRAAIQLADEESGDTIVVPAGTYELGASLGGLEVSSAMTIKGDGSATTVVDGLHHTGVLDVEFVARTVGTVTISGITIRNGQSTGPGPGILNNSGTLSLTDVVVTGGSTTSVGGGIASDGPLTVDNVVVSGNEAGDGGGLALLGTVQTTILHSTISGNTADGLPPADPDSGNTIHLAGHGGGVLLDGVNAFGGPAPSLTVTRSAITGNTASAELVSDPVDFAQGGGIFNIAGTLGMANDTVAGNKVIGPAGNPQSRAVGGGITQTDPNATAPVSAARANSPRGQLDSLVPRLRAAESAGLGRPRTSDTTSVAVTTLDFVTLAGDDAGLFGGISTLAGKFSVTNSIVAGNTGGNCGNPGAVTSTGYNLESGSDCRFRQTGDQFDVDPKLDALKVNDPGSTATMAPLPGSPAIDAADPHCDQSVDQRGVTRPQGPRCDIGAFEVAQASSATSTPSPPVTGARAPATPNNGLAAAVVALLAPVALAALRATKLRR